MQAIKKSDPLKLSGSTPSKKKFIPKNGMLWTRYLVGTVCTNFGAISKGGNLKKKKNWI